MAELVKVRVQLPHGSDPTRGPGWTDLYVREGTPDEDVIQEVFVLDVYHLRGLQLRPTPPAQLDLLSDAWTPRIIDLGACTGTFSALACQMFPNAQVTAVEPNGENFELLRRNTDKWANRVERVHAAVGASAGNLSTVGDGATGHTETAPPGGGDVEQVTLERLIGGGQMVALLKIDIEGAEYATLDACPVEKMALVDQIVMEWHGPEMAPWAHPSGTNVQYGDMLHKLAFTHAVNVYGDPNRGGMLFAHRYPE